jgi:ATP-dependent DNA ligase
MNTVGSRPEDRKPQQLAHVALDGCLQRNISKHSPNPGENKLAATDPMTDRKINNPRSWNVKALVGDWLVTLKVDGVRAIWHDEHGWMSRANKPLHNIPRWRDGQSRDCEVFVNNFRDTIRATRTRCLDQDTPSITRENLYGLDLPDPRLRWGSLTNPTPAEIIAQLHRANKLYYEGLVLRRGDQWIKVKPEETHDISITGYAEGRGKHRGRLGFVTTTRGAVGAGFTDAEREILWAEANAGRLVGQVIEVSCMQFTPNGQFRHPVFVRMRPDKPSA